MQNEEPNQNIIEELIALFNRREFNRVINIIDGILKKKPNSILVNNILGASYTELKKYSLAKKTFIKITKLNTKFVDGHYNLANIYKILGQEDMAIESYNKVIELNKNYYKAYNNLGNIFRNKDQKKRAVEYYIITLLINPNYRKAYYNLGGILQHYILNEKNIHINKFYLYLLEQKTIVRPNAISSNVINGLYLNTDLKDIFALTDETNFPNNLIQIIKRLNNNLLFIQFMKVCPIPSYYIEKNLKKIRKELLNEVFNLRFENIYFGFIVALSTQCFMNEYIFSETEDEIKKVTEINERINNNLKKRNRVNDLEILCLTCYAPLHSYKWSNKITPSKELLEIYDLQFTNYKEEKKKGLLIKSIAKIKDDVSIKVQQQYEENPYPRWTNLGLSFQPGSIKDVISDINLDIDLKKINFPEKPEILIAGCGTGQHALTTASKYYNSIVYALDLSLKSLSYAKRKADEMGINNINFIQGDLLDLKLLNKKFDIIESVGVIHHMDDPFLGWKSLTNCLKNDSLILIGLYSENARKNISAIRKKIKKLKIETSKKNIINFRKDLLENNNSEWDSIKYSPDFYSTSGVRDLLFHVQEHRFTIPKIREYLKKLGLNFLGFEDTFVIDKFRKIYNQSSDIYNLDNWEEFENKNERIFSGMYQFWCKKS